MLSVDYRAEETPTSGLNGPARVMHPQFCDSIVDGEFIGGTGAQFHFANREEESNDGGDFGTSAPSGHIWSLYVNPTRLTFC